MNDDSLIEARNLTKELLLHFLKVWLACIPFMMGAFALSWVTTPPVFTKVCELLAIINTFYFGVICGCFAMYNIFWEKMKTAFQKENQKNE